jgi:hypothetical protein
MSESTHRSDCNGREIFVGDVVLWPNGWTHKMIPFYSLKEIVRAENGRWLLGSVWNQWKGPELMIATDDLVSPEVQQAVGIDRGQNSWQGYIIIDETTGKFRERTLVDLIGEEAAARHTEDILAVERALWFGTMTQYSNALPSSRKPSIGSSETSGS